MYSIDATKTESLCKFVNDSTNGNCKMRQIYDGDQPFLCLFATDDINVGTELRYDYGDSSEKLWWRNEVRKYYLKLT